MKPISTDGEAQPRLSTESKRSFSAFGLGRKRSTDLESQHDKPSGGRRFSLLPQSMSFRGLMGNKDHNESNTPRMQEQTWSDSRPPTGPTYSNQVPNNDGQQDSGRPVKYNNFSRPPQAQYRQQPTARQQNHDDVYGGTGVYHPSDVQGRGGNGDYEPPSQYSTQDSRGYAEQGRPSMQQSRPGRSVLTKQNRRFAEGYDNEPGSHGGSSGAVKKVQDFFRRRGRARADGDYR